MLILEPTWEDFYNPYNQAYLKKVFADLNDGKVEVHDLIELQKKS
jgi:hypothetical protein